MTILSRRQFNFLTLAASVAAGMSAAATAFAADETSVVLLLSGTIADGGWASTPMRG